MSAGLINMSRVFMFRESGSRSLAVVDQEVSLTLMIRMAFFVEAAGKYSPINHRFPIHMSIITSMVLQPPTHVVDIDKRVIIQTTVLGLVIIMGMRERLLQQDCFTTTIVKAT